MKRLPILMILLVLLLGAPVFVSGLHAADDTDKAIKEHVLIKERIQKLLNKLRRLADEETDPEKKQQYLAVIKYAESSDANLLDEIGKIIELLKDQEDIEAAAKDQTLLALLGQIELLLKGYDLDLDAKLANLKAIIAELRVIQAQMNEILKQMPSSAATAQNIADAIKEVGILEEKQREILENMKSDDHTDQAPKQGDLKDQTEKLAEKLEAMSGADKGKDGKPGEGKGGQPTKAEAAAGKAGESAGAAGKSMGKASNAMAKSGGKSEAQTAGEQAMKHLEEAKKALEEAKAEAQKKAKAEKYKLKELAEKQKRLAEKLKSLKEKAKLSGASDQAQKSIQKAQEATAKSAEKTSGAGKPGESQPGTGQPGECPGCQGKKKDGGGGKQDQEEAKKALEEALKQLQEDYELMNQIKKLMEIKKVLEEMIKRQKAIYNKTNNLNIDQVKGLEKDSGFKFDRMQLTEMNEIRDDEENLSRMTGMMSKLLDEEGKLVFIYMLKKIEENMNEVVVLLDEQDVGGSTLSLENRILRDLQMLLQTLQDELDSLEEQKKKKQKPSKSPPKKEEKKPSLLPPLAEIELLKFLEETIKSDTIEINREFAEDPKNPMPSYKKKIKARLCERLSTKQAEIEELTRNIIEAIKKQK